MTDYLDDEVEHLLAAYHEAGHTLAVLEVEKLEAGLLDEISIDEDAGEVVWYSSTAVPIEPKIWTTVHVAGMVACKVMMPRTEWWEGAEEDMERAVAITGNSGMRKSFEVFERELKKSRQKVRLMTVAMLLIEKSKITRDEVLKALGEI